MSAAAIGAELRALADPAIASHAQRFFRTAPGEYGAGDRFLGIRVPVLRRLVPRHADLPLPVLTQVLHSEFHEQRLFALLALVRRFERRAADREAVYALYLANTTCINNWDLVDSSAPQIVGGWLRSRDRAPLYRLARSESLWERRIALLATFTLIRAGDLDDTFALAGQLLGDGEDLIHKAAGWMLREAGKRDGAALRGFLHRHAGAMPRTMLRYAIEKFPPAERQAWLAVPR